jgi:hypothetical protein
VSRTETQPGSERDPAPLPEIPDRTPWVETRPGALFFVSAVLVAPVVMALYPWVLRWGLRTFAGFDRPSRILDPVPAVAAYVAPVVGWLALPALVVVVRALRVVDRAWARRLLWVFAALHVGTLIYTAGRWLG